MQHMAYKQHTMCAGGNGKGPQWTYGDLATRWGMSTHELTYFRTKFPGFPEPSLTHNAGLSAGKRTYYDLHAAVKWYKTACKQIREEIESLKQQM